MTHSLNYYKGPWICKFGKWEPVVARHYKPCTVRRVSPSGWPSAWDEIDLVMMFNWLYHTCLGLWEVRLKKKAPKRNKRFRNGTFAAPNVTSFVWAIAWVVIMHVTQPKCFRVKQTAEKYCGMNGANSSCRHFVSEKKKNCQQHLCSRSRPAISCLNLVRRCKVVGGDSLQWMLCWTPVFASYVRLLYCHLKLPQSWD